jgi:hypothetical protein
MLMWKIYVASNNKTHVDIYVKWLMLHKNNIIFAASYQYSDVQFAYTEHNDGYVAVQFLCFVSLAVKHCMISDGISQLWSSACLHFCLNYPASKAHAPHYTLWSPVVCWLLVPCFSTLSRKRNSFPKKKILNMRASIFSTTSVWNISHSKNKIS